MNVVCSQSSINTVGIIYNYPPKERWIVVDIIYRNAKRRGMHLPLFTDPEGDSCFSINQIRWIKKRFFNFFFWNFSEMTRHFSLRLQNSEYPRIFQVMGAHQNARKLLSTDLVNTNVAYCISIYLVITSGRGGVHCLSSCLTSHFLFLHLLVF